MKKSWCLKSNSQRGLLLKYLAFNKTNKKTEISRENEIYSLKNQLNE